jgi:predicted dehydrogenase
MRKKITRRDFIGNSARAAAGAGLISSFPAYTLSGRTGPNDTVNLGIVGLKSHGSWAHLWNSYYNMDGVRIVALCDPDRAILDREAKKFYDKGEKVNCYTDIRKLLENKDVDAISGATPNHWHALSTVWACQAGKDVCVEKPVSHNIWEGRKMVEAAEKYNRIVQADLDIRSQGEMYEAIDYIQSGELGDILLAHSWVYKRRKSIGKVKGAGYVPKTVDYDLWCGPGPNIPLPRINLHYDWHWQWDYGNGEIGNNGPHHLDVCRWALGQKGLAPRVISFGGRYGYDDDGETPNTQITVFDYKPAPIIFEVRGLPSRNGVELMDPFMAKSKKGMSVYHKPRGASWNHSTIIVCEHGYVDLGYRTVHDADGYIIKKFDSRNSLSSAENFIKALRSRKEEDIKTTILEGHLSTSLCHMGNISYRVGNDISFEEVNDVIKRDDEVMDAYSRTKEHLVANGIKLDDNTIRMGPWLTMDPEKERFTGKYAEQANNYVKREYREPYVIRDQV